MKTIYLLLYFIFILFTTDPTKCAGRIWRWHQDRLNPYKIGHHGPTYSHLVVQSRQNQSSGYATSESYSATTNLATSQVKVHNFVDDFHSSFFAQNLSIYGRLIVVNNPLRTISVLEPHSPGGCNMSIMSTVADTAQRAHCHVAMNAGFYNAESGTCYGNIISNGRRVKIANVQNVNFGIRKNGSIIVGYLTEEEILDDENPFVQLVSGVIWLVRNGKLYIKESIEMESSQRDDLGILKQFVEARSARNAIGHDRDGNVMLMQIEGQTNLNGLNLYDFAKKLIESGFVNAINLDGGGSSTTVIDGVTVGYPSNHCSKSNTAFGCSRAVSTVICIQDLHCLPQDCNNHGKCINGKCLCNDHWTGETCDITICEYLRNCSGNGQCTQDGCNCNPGWVGLFCELAHPRTDFGQRCYRVCNCENGAKLDLVTGDCPCLQDWTESFCDRECPLGFYGKLCIDKCNCDSPCMCNLVTGKCEKESERCNRLNKSRGYIEFESTPTATNLASPQIKVHEFMDDFYSSFFSESLVVYGRLIVIEDPLRTVSVLEPNGPGGCNISTMATVVDTSRRAGCYLAMNAGYFNAETRGCLGNIISNGRLVRITSVKNVNFGIRKNGSIIVGYLTEDDILDSRNPFIQLISGVIWLVRNGKSYVKESMEMESIKREDIRLLKWFVETKSARNAIGHDRDGNVMLVQTEGQTNFEGLNLYDFAEKLIESGFVNAINLDGGGSLTTVVKGVTIGFPSDPCESNIAYRCTRPVSTVICAHRLHCIPQDCNNHGRCLQGKCLCNHNWTGEACEITICGYLHNCSGNGLCTPDGCSCNPGWIGLYCQKACPATTFGQRCNQTCICQNGAQCDPITGKCSCLQGWTGRYCDRECPFGLYGKLCVHKCTCDLLCMCNPITGECESQSRRCHYHKIQCQMKSRILKYRLRKLDFFGYLAAFIVNVFSSLYIFLLVQ